MAVDGERMQAQAEAPAGGDAAAAPALRGDGRGTASRRVRARVLVPLLALALLGGAGIASYYAYMDAHFVTTEDARIAADLVAVTPQVAGRLASWTAREGDRVEAGQVLGTVDPGASAGLPASLPGVPAAGGGDALAGADRTAVRAPVGGVVIRSPAVVGSAVAPGQPLAYLADPERFYVLAEVEETRIRRVRPGQLVTIRLDAYPGATLTGRVESLGLATESTFSLLPAQNASGNFTKVTQRIPVKVSLPAASGLRLVPGMSATVTIRVR